MEYEDTLISYTNANEYGEYDIENKINIIKTFFGNMKINIIYKNADSAALHSTDNIEDVYICEILTKNDDIDVCEKYKFKKIIFKFMKYDSEKKYDVMKLITTTKNIFPEIVHIDVFKKFYVEECIDVKYINIYDLVDAKIVKKISNKIKLLHSIPTPHQIIGPIYKLVTFVIPSCLFGVADKPK